MTQTIRKTLLVFLTNTLHMFSPLKPSTTSHIKQPVVHTKKPEKYLGAGMASVYGTEEDGFLGKLTASGIRLTSNMMTVAHRTLPFGTLLKIINPRTGQYVFARVADRGPYVSGRVLDLNSPVATAIGINSTGRVIYSRVQSVY